MTGTSQEWALAVLRRSVLKQEKLRRIVDLLGDTAGSTCLDLGGDNGVISLLLRERGGTWWSGDLDERTVDAIRDVVGDRVVRIDAGHLPFDDASFDTIVIVDLIEHVPDDRSLIAELGRLLKPGGALIINTPHLKPHSAINRLRDLAGLTDEWHGHVRPGYTVGSLGDLLGPAFQIETSRTYSRAFSEWLDLVLNVAYQKRRGSGSIPASRKGTVVTRTDLDSRSGAYRALTLVYPFLRFWSWLDVLLPFQEGYKVIVRARRCATS